MIIKVCCVQSVAEAQCVVNAGADMIGLVSQIPSGPGVIPDDHIRKITMETAGHIERVLLTSHTAPDAICAQLDRIPVDSVQIVDHVPANLRAAIKQSRPDIRIIQVVHVIDEQSIGQAIALADGSDQLLLDSGRPGTKSLGGTGQTHNWEISREIVKFVTIPVLLAGGLNPANVIDAIQDVRPAGVDVCSGSRDDQMNLHSEKLMSFVNAVRRFNG